MIDRVVLNNKQSPPLESRITAMLNNTNGDSAALIELISEVEQRAIPAAEQNILTARDKAADVIAAPTPREAQDAIKVAEAAELELKRLRGAVPKLREKLTIALAAESHERWFADYRRVQQKLDNATTLFKTYQRHAEAIAQIFALASEIDKEVSRINGNAPDGEHLRLRSVELEARDLERFDRDNPSLTATIELRDWENSGRKLWPCASSGSMAAAFAGSMAVPYHPGSRWADADEQARRRAETEKHHREIGGFYQRETEAQEQRLNAEERERFAASRRLT